VWWKHPRRARPTGRPSRRGRRATAGRPGGGHHSCARRGTRGSAGAMDPAGAGRPAQRAMHAIRAPDRAGGTVRARRPGLVLAPRLPAARTDHQEEEPPLLRPRQSTYRQSLGSASKTDRRTSTFVARTEVLTAAVEQDTCAAVALARKDCGECLDRRSETSSESMYQSSPWRMYCFCEAQGCGAGREKRMTWALCNDFSGRQQAIPKDIHSPYQSLLWLQAAFVGTYRMGHRCRVEK